MASCWVKGNCTWIFFTAFSLYKPQICCWVTQPLPLFLWDQAVKQGRSQAVRGLLWLANSWHGTHYTFGTCGWASTLLAKQTRLSSSSYRSHQQGVELERHLQLRRPWSKRSEFSFPWAVCVKTKLETSKIKKYNITPRFVVIVLFW